MCQHLLSGILFRLFSVFPLTSSAWPSPLRESPITPPFSGFSLPRFHVKGRGPDVTASPLAELLSRIIMAGPLYCGTEWRCILCSSLEVDTEAWQTGQELWITCRTFWCYVLWQKKERSSPCSDSVCCTFDRSTPSVYHQVFLFIDHQFVSVVILFLFFLIVFTNTHIVLLAENAWPKKEAHIMFCAHDLRFFQS